MPDFALRERRKAHSWTAADIAKRCGVRVARYIGIEREWWGATEDEIERLALLFQASKEELCSPQSSTNATTAFDLTRWIEP